jgi:hypothetical protein
MGLKIENFTDDYVLDRNFNKGFWSVMHRGVKEQRIAYFEEEWPSR